MMDSEGRRLQRFRDEEFSSRFQRVDHRQVGKVDYPLTEVLLLILLAVLGGELSRKLGDDGVR
jgi:hypothetical protein